MLIVLTILVVVFILMGNELWWRTKHPHGEISRKLIHILVGSFVAFWPFYLSWTDIEILSGLFFVVVFISKQLNIFRAIHSVQRPTWGELYFAVAVGGVALITHDKWIYMAALLQMGLADGLAAVVGSRFGGGNKYQILGHTKSLIGSLTFLIVSVGILIAYSALAPGLIFKSYFGIIAVVATLLENFSAFGLDNVLVPFFIALSLKL